MRVWEEEEGWNLADSHEIERLSTIETPEVLGLEDAIVAVRADRTAVLTSGLEVHQLPSDPTVEVVLLKSDFQAEVATFSGDGSLVALGVPGERRVQILSALTGESILTLPEHASEIASLAFRPDGRQLAVGCNTGDVRLWELPSGAPADRSGISGDRTCRDLTYSHDGRLLATVFQRNARSYAQVWDVETGQQRGPGLAHSAIVRNVFCNADASLAATVDDREVLRCYHAKARPALDLIFAQGSRQADLLRDYWPEAKGRIATVGNPRADLLRAAGVDRRGDDDLGEAARALRRWKRQP